MLITITSVALVLKESSSLHSDELIFGDEPYERIREQLNVKIDPMSKIPFYQQLTQQLLFEIARGNLQNGDSLPSIRDLAAETNLNLHTVHKSYKELQKKGIIDLKPSSKAIVKKSAEANAVNLQQISIKVEQIMCEANALGISEHQLQQMFHKNLRKYYTQR